MVLTSSQPQLKVVLMMIWSVHLVFCLPVLFTATKVMTQLLLLALPLALRPTVVLEMIP